MHIEILVEEPSAEAALQNLVPKILGTNVEYNFIVFEGKPDLLASLPRRLKGYRSWIPQDWRIVVVVDADESGCEQLKQRLETEAAQCGFVTPARARSGGLAQFEVLIRLPVYELEAWFFGDVPAMVAAYAGVSESLATKRRYRNPDAIPRAWEALEQVLQNAGHHRNGLAKIRAAREISAHMDPERNRSLSFQMFRSGLLAAVHGL